MYFLYSLFFYLPASSKYFQSANKFQWARFKQNEKMPLKSKQIPKYVSNLNKIKNMFQVKTKYKITFQFRHNFCSASSPPENIDMHLFWMSDIFCNLINLTLITLTFLTGSSLISSISSLDTLSLLPSLPEFVIRGFYCVSGSVSEWFCF